MEYEVIVEFSAEKDLFEILTYFSKILFEPSAAERIYLSAKEQVRSLSFMPNRYALVNEEPYRSLGVRKILIENYIAFYIVDEDLKTVRVLRIQYNRREWRNLI